MGEFQSEQRRHSASGTLPIGPTSGGVALPRRCIAREESGPWDGGGGGYLVTKELGGFEKAADS